MASFNKRGVFSNFFWKRLKTEPLSSIIKYASKADNGLDVQLRGNYINIYYKGGNILKIKPKSFFFDKFYFYTGCKKEDRSTRKTIILDASKGKEQEGLSKKEALQIVNELEDQADKLIKLLDISAEKYFDTAKSVIDKWLEIQQSALDINHNEKASQHLISLYNRSFDTSDIIVIDLEYAISQKASFAEKNGNPRPDIIGVDRSGQIHVLELKYRFQATEGDAGIEQHILDFEKTIGKDSKGDFVSEMYDLVESKKELGLIDCQCNVDIHKKPVFDLIFRGTEQDVSRFVTQYGHFKTDGRVHNIFYLLDNSNYRLFDK